MWWTVPFTSMHLQYLNRISTQLVHAVPWGGVQRGHAYQCDALLLVRTCTYLPTWWTNWTLAREWNDVCSFSNDPFRHCSANNSHEHSVLYKRVRYVYSFRILYYARIPTAHSTSKMTRKLHNVFYTSCTVLFLHIKVQHEFSKGFAVSQCNIV